MAQTSDCHRIEIWGSWRPSQHLKLYHILQIIPEQFLQCGRKHHPAERGHIPRSYTHTHVNPRLGLVC